MNHNSWDYSPPPTDPYWDFTSLSVSPPMYGSQPLSRYSSSGGTSSHLSSAPPSPLTDAFFPAQIGYMDAPEPGPSAPSPVSPCADDAGSYINVGEPVNPQGSGSNALYFCLYPSCSASFKRPADLQRHMKHVHQPAKNKDAFYCDYERCPRHQDPITRFDHYREHLREGHKEYIEKRGVPIDEKWLKSRRIRYDWWRCPRCLKRVDIAEHGGKCPTCKGSRHRDGRQ